MPLTAVYRYFESTGTLAFIDLNKRYTGIKKYKDDITVSDQDVSLMKKGACTCDAPCPDSTYGRRVYTYTHDNPRLFPPVVRNSEAWNGIYNAERPRSVPLRGKTCDRCLRHEPFGESITCRQKEDDRAKRRGVDANA